LKAFDLAISLNLNILLDVVQEYFIPIMIFLLLSLQRQIPVNHAYDLACRSMTTNQLPDDGSHKTQHRHTPVETLNKTQRSLIPWAFRGQTLAESFQRFVLEILA
jgi:hypothetical protein